MATVVSRRRRQSAASPGADDRLSQLAIEPPAVRRRSLEEAGYEPGASAVASQSVDVWRRLDEHGWDAVSWVGDEPPEHTARFTGRAHSDLPASLVGQPLEEAQATLRQAGYRSGFTSQRTRRDGRSAWWVAWIAEDESHALWFARSAQRGPSRVVDVVAGPLDPGLAIDADYARIITRPADIRKGDRLAVIAAALDTYRRADDTVVGDLRYVTWELSGEGGADAWTDRWRVAATNVPDEWQALVVQAGRPGDGLTGFEGQPAGAAPVARGHTGRVPAHSGRTAPPAPRPRRSAPPPAPPRRHLRGDVPAPPPTLVWPPREPQAAQERRHPGSVRRAVGRTLVVAGVLAITDAALTVAWQEPISALVGSAEHERLSERLARTERAPARPPSSARFAQLEDAARISYHARRARAGATTGDPLGRLSIRKLGLRAVVVQGAGTSNLRGGPGHYSFTALPGEPGTVGIAGHRTTYTAPFRRLDQLRKGDRIEIRTPYGQFVYSVDRSRIVTPEQVWVLRNTRRHRLVLTACHPLFSAAQRLVVFASLRQQLPLGPARRQSDALGPRGPLT